jgi:hypothetical protein
LFAHHDFVYHLSLPSLKILRSVCRRLILGLLGSGGRATSVVANSALVTELALALAVVVVREAAALLELAVTLEVEAAKGVALPLTLGLKGTANEGLLSACTHAKGSTTATVALLHVHGVHALLLVTAIATASAKATGVALEATHAATATAGDHTLALGGEGAAVEATGIVVLLLRVHWVRTINLLLLHDELRTIELFFVFVFSSASWDEKKVNRFVKKRLPEMGVISLNRDICGHNFCNDQRTTPHTPA